MYKNNDTPVYEMDTRTMFRMKSYWNRSDFTRCICIYIRTTSTQNISKISRAKYEIHTPFIPAQGHRRSNNQVLK